ncbi:unnamed protein product [Heligmosomoides polygyrus]|uniref:SAM domain-containing protein n=1 Tax=Heligmosomoides polygyrus TaxID=6339 RepID=A0A183FUH1_HELPZ|nr:unnamed protein product [Heligmosomoides polygyrus]
MLCELANLPADLSVVKQEPIVVKEEPEDHGYRSAGISHGSSVGMHDRHVARRMSVKEPVIRREAMGNFTALGKISHINYQLTKYTASELKMMHKVLYGKAGRLTSVRAEIRKFTGFGFKEGSPDFENKVAQIERIDFRHLRMIKHILGLRSRGSSKAHVVDIIMNFLVKPDRRTVKRCRPTKCRECSKRDAKQGDPDKVTTNNGIDEDKKKENKKEQGPIPNVSKSSKKAAKKQLAAKTSKVNTSVKSAKNGAIEKASTAKTLKEVATAATTEQEMVCDSNSGVALGTLSEGMNSSVPLGTMSHGMNSYVPLGTMGDCMNSGESQPYYTDLQSAVECYNNELQTAIHHL